VDIWPARQPAEVTFATAQPVAAAVWDSGYDATLFLGQLTRDSAEPLDGRDNDGNGVADDWNGPTYDIDLRPRVSAMITSDVTPKGPSIPANRVISLPAVSSR
jgi:hypothetical protein